VGRSLHFESTIASGFALVGADRAVDAHDRPGTGVRVYLACGCDGYAQGIAGLGGALAQDVLRQKPASGAVLRSGSRGDRLKLLYGTGRDFCLYYKVASNEASRGQMPQNGAMRLNLCAAACLWEGIDGGVRIGVLACHVGVILLPNYAIIYMVHFV